MCISWTKIKLSDKFLLDSVINGIEAQESNLDEHNIDEVCKIFWSFQMLKYNNDKLSDAFQKYIEEYLPKISMDHLIDLFISYTSLFPSNRRNIERFIHNIINKKSDNQYQLDIGSYVNIWLGLSKFYLKGGEMALEVISHMLKYLFSNYDKREYLNARNMTLDEVCSMLVCFSVMDLEPNTIYDDLCKFVKANINKFDSNHLVQLISCGKYLFNTKKHNDLYFIIHDACVGLKQSFNNNQIAVIKRVLNNDGIVPSSVFIEEKK